MTKEEEKTALERKLKIAVDGHSAELVTQALMNALHNHLGYAELLVVRERSKNGCMALLEQIANVEIRFFGINPLTCFRFYVVKNIGISLKGFFSQFKRDFKQFKFSLFIHGDSPI